MIRHLSAGDPQDPLVVDAAPVRDAVGDQVRRLGAGREREAAPGERSVGFGEFLPERAHRVLRPLDGVDPMRGEVVADLPVVGDVRKAHDRRVGEAREGFRRAGPFFEQPIRGQLGREDERVVPPEDGVGAERVGETPEGVDAVPPGGELGFEPLRFVVVEGEVDHHSDPAAAQFREVLQKRLWVLGPEDDEADVFERHEALPPAEGVPPRAVAAREPSHEPIRVERRDVGAAAR